MGIHNIETVIEDWRLEKITTEQAIGKILLVLKELEARVAEVEKRTRRPVPPKPRPPRPRGGLPPKA